MNPSRVSLAFIFLCFLITVNVASTDDIVSINCGSTGTCSARSRRKWLGDVQPRTSPMLQLKGLSTTSTAIHMLSSADPVPYKTARVSNSHFSYVFQVNPGQKTIRLHFNPTAYTGFKGLKDLFTVEAGPFTLLANFSASLNANALRVNSFTKEFCLNIQENQLLHINFSAETSQSKDAYAFINGIEIISVPPSLSYFQGGDIGLQVVGRNSPINVDNSIALEIIHRLNTKQDLIQSVHDSDDIFGMTWKISVDVGFRNLVRLHFSKLGLKMAETGALNFKVFINEMIADTNTDIVVKERDSSSIPWYGDYIVMMNGHKREGKCDLLIRLQSNVEFMDGPLRGFEILKLSNPDNSLASPVFMPPSQDSTSQTIQILLKVLGNRNAIGTVVVTILSIVSIIVHKLREISEASSSVEVNRPSARAERLCRRFSLSEMQLATRNFSDGLKIGRGGFGNVYKGLIDREKRTVAVKRLKPNSSQGAREFLTEIETLSELRDINLVSLIGYCSEHREMILVYEYMACGTLGDHLYNFARRGMGSTSLTWKQRINICIGAARGLDYLHTGHRVIHRDVKASNILLDDNFVAKVSDFGLAKAEDRSKSQSHVSTKVKGTYGYLDPYYYSTRKLTRKSDTYALGVVLLEVLCGRPAVDSEASLDERVLTTWARDKIGKGEVDQIVASNLRDEISPNSQKIFLEITERCLHEEPKNRPTMSQVVLQLELALKQQDNNQDLGLNEIASVSDEIRPSTSNVGAHLSSTLQPTVESLNMQNLILSSNEQTNSKVIISGKKHRGKSTRNKSSKLWPWDALWNRVKPSKKSKSLSSVTNLLKFDWDQIAAATNHFSSSNIVGHGRFGGIYKGILPSGEVVAVKRRSSSFAEGLKELKNEMNILPNFLHQNIIRLLGYCMDGEELLLVYEFMENTSLDYFIDKGQEQHLPWAVRFQMIMGIARGLVYLHQDYRPKVIHGDLNISSILLDSNMNPKISDFDLSIKFDTEMEFEASGVKATHGCMPPEYYMHGNVSVKTDVYSFGIVLLEIVSGKRMFSLYLSRSLVEHMISQSIIGNRDDLAWMQWNERRAIDSVYDSLGCAFLDDEVKRCIDVARLCIQEHPHQRPSMRSVTEMLQGNEQIMQLRLWPSRETSAGIDGNGAFELELAADIKLLKFNWDQIAAATGHFSFSNLVGRGQFGFVFKAVLPSGEVVAVKSRSSSSTAEGQEEFKNEINVLSSLQHRNITKLLGYCMDREALLLVYEFLENKSLDNFIDKGQEQYLQWAVRFQIIMGIARGLLYLHQDSGLRVIHRHLKLSNILLDFNMNPKIYDFGLARSIIDHQSEQETSQVAGTFGYMPPEYFHNRFSVKSDVFSFGIMLLEIVSGKRIFTLNLEYTYFVEHAWNLWNEGRAIELVDNSLGSTFEEDEATRCIQVALLCTQDHPDHRPAMPLVILMLEGNKQMMQPRPPVRFLGGNGENTSDVGLDSNAELNDTLDSLEMYRRTGKEKLLPQCSKEEDFGSTSTSHSHILLPAEVPVEPQLAETSPLL